MRLHRITVEVQENIAHHISFNSLLMNLGQQYKKSFKFKDFLRKDEAREAEIKK